MSENTTVKEIGIKENQFGTSEKPGPAVQADNIIGEKWTTKKARKTLWITRSMAEDFGRDDILRATFRDTLIYIIFVILVTVYAMLIRERNWYYLTKAMQQQFLEMEFETTNGFGITFEEIKTPEDFWNYAQKHMIGIFFWESTFGDRNIKNIKDDDMNILYENRILGAPRIRQVKMSRDSCKVHPYFQTLFEDCFGVYAEEAEDKANISLRSPAWTYRGGDVSKSLRYTGQISTYGGGGFYSELATKQRSIRILKVLKDNSWITRGTRAVFIDFSVYNANLNIFCICKLVFEFPATGGVIPSAKFNSLNLIEHSGAANWPLLVCEYGMYVFAGFFLLEAIREVFYFQLKFLIKFWSYIQATIIMCTIILWSLNGTRKRKVPPAIDDVIKNPKQYANLEHVAYLQLQYNHIFAIYLFVVYVGIFKYVNINKTMGQLNSTLSRCALDILGFSIMFFIIFLAFAELGHLLFGSQVEKFSTFGMSMFTLLQTILGEFDYGEIKQANRTLAPMYFLSYIFLVFFVLLNMFLAIINDTYGDVKTEIAIAPDELQMTEYFSGGIRRIFEILGCVRKRREKGETDLTIRQIREALRKCGFSDVEMEMFFARYKIDSRASDGEYNIQVLRAELGGISGRADRRGFVHISEFIRQQERLQDIDRTMVFLADQVKLLINKLDVMDNVVKRKKAPS